MAVELYKTANAQTSLICEAMLGRLGSDGQVYNKIGLVLVLRDNSNKALKTLWYYLAGLTVNKVSCLRIGCSPLPSPSLCNSFF
jgi:hypothetical protein